MGAKKSWIVLVIFLFSSCSSYRASNAFEKRARPDNSIISDHLLIRITDINGQPSEKFTLNSFSIFERYYEFPPGDVKIFINYNVQNCSGYEFNPGSILTTNTDVCGYAEGYIVIYFKALPKTIYRLGTTVSEAYGKSLIVQVIDPQGKIVGYGSDYLK
jgi:hypothetical protein